MASTKGSLFQYRIMLSGISHSVRDFLPFVRRG